MAHQHLLQCLQLKRQLKAEEETYKDLEKTKMRKINYLNDVLRPMLTKVCMGL